MKNLTVWQKVLAIIVALTMFLGVLPLSFVSAQNSDEASFTELKLSFDENYENAAYWVIELTLDKEIGFGDNSYWYRNLQQIDDAAGEEHNALAQILRDNILINGKSIDDGLNESDDKATSTRIKVGSVNDNTLNKMWIAVIAEFVAQKDNVYGINDYTEFTLEFKEGIIINHTPIKPVKYRYCPYDQTFRVEDGTRDFVAADFEKNSNYENDEYYVIKLTSETDIGFGDNSYWFCNLQQISDAAGKEHNALARVLRENIFINGKSIADGLESATDKTTSTRIKIGCEGENTTKYLYVAVKCSDNSYGISSEENFKFEIKNSIIINGVKMNPTKYIYSSKSGKMIYADPKVPDYIDDPNGATIQSVTLQKGDASCSEHLSGESYFIRILTDKKLENISLASQSFYNRHLQNCEENQIKEMLLSKISINGKVLKDCTIDYWKDLHIKASDKTLEIEIPVENTFNFDGHTDFEVKVDLGITLNGYALNPRKITYTAKTGDGEFVVEKLKGSNFDKFISLMNLNQSEIADNPDYATIQGVTIQKGNASCSGHNSGEAWYIRIATNKAFGSNNSYWWRHLQADSGNCANGADLRSKIKLNGKTLEDCLNGGDAYKFMHIHVADGSKVIELEIPTDNTYGFNGDADFTVELAEGVAINNVGVNPRTITYDADASGEKFSITTPSSTPDDKDDTTADNPDYATIQGVTIEKRNASCSEHSSGTVWHIKITTDKAFGSNNSYWWRHLQADSGNCANGSDLRSKIKLNGKTLEECLNGGDAYKFMHIHVADGSKVIELEIPTDNTYGFNGDADFTIELAEGVAINNIGVNPRNITYIAKVGTGSFKIDKLDVTIDEGFEIATITDVSIVDASPTCCGDASHKIESAWHIRLTTDKNFGSDNNFNWRHLQANPGEYADKEIINSKIRINGKSLKQLLGDGNAYSFMHIKISNATPNVIEIVVPKNAYGVSNAQDFSIDILEGVTINGINLKAQTVSYTAASGNFTISNYVPKFENAIITGVTLVNDSDKYWLIKIATDKDISVTGDISNDLQFIDRQRTAERKALANEIANKITINGETLAESMERAGNHYTARVSMSGNNIILKVNMKTPTTYDNDFYIGNKEDFTVCIKEELSVANIKIKSARYRFDSESGQFVVDNSQDVKNIGEPKLYITASYVDEETGKGINFWPGGTTRYVHLLLDAKLKGTSHNAEAYADAHGAQCREFIYVDGLSISEWIAYGEGNLYQVMVRFKGNIIEFLFDGSREPGMVEDEVHWIEFKEGLYSAAGEKIMPQKLYYDPKIGNWELVDSFDGLEKPWFLTDYESKTNTALKGWENDKNYVLKWYESDEKALSQKLLNYEEALKEYEDENGSEQTINNEQSQNKSEDKVVVKKYRKVTPTVYESYIPVGVIILIVVGVISVVVTVVLIVIKNKKKSSKIRR